MRELSGQSYVSIREQGPDFKGFWLPKKKKKKDAVKSMGLPSSVLFPNDFAVILRCQAQALNFSPFILCFH